MQDGIIYPIVNGTVEFLNKLNLVEAFKWLGRKINPDKTNRVEEIAYERICVDLFIILKWVFVLLVWYAHFQAPVLTIFIWYLIVTNFYTYFYRHIWCDDVFNPNPVTNKERVRRRFVNLFLGFSYSNVCFAYFYRLPYAEHFTKPSDTVSAGLHSFWFSVSNSIAANYSGVQPLTEFGNSLAMVQLMITFIFVTIIISKSN